MNPADSLNRESPDFRRSMIQQLIKHNNVSAVIGAILSINNLEDMCMTIRELRTHVKPDMMAEIDQAFLAYTSLRVFP